MPAIGGKHNPVKGYHISQPPKLKLPFYAHTIQDFIDKEYNSFKGIIFVIDPLTNHWSWVTALKKMDLQQK